MKLILTTLIVVTFSSNALANLPDFNPFQKILTKYLVEKTTDKGFHTEFQYQKAFDDPEVQKLVERQKEILKKKDLSKLESKDEAIAFWINTYNFLMIAKIFKDGFKNKKLKINSVKDMGSFFSPYKAFSQKDFEVGGQKVTLDQVEKKILLGEEYKKRKWKDSRVHFAVNCASVGCPPLIKMVYSPKNVDHQLNLNVKQAMKSSRHFYIDGKTLHLTKLFDWYDDDFEDEAGSIKDYLMKFADSQELKDKIKATSKIKHIKYDWNLNRAENF